MDNIQIYDPAFSVSTSVSAPPHPISSACACQASGKILEWVAVLLRVGLLGYTADAANICEMFATACSKNLSSSGSFNPDLAL